MAHLIKSYRGNRRLRAEKSHSTSNPEIDKFERKFLLLVLLPGEESNNSLSLVRRDLVRKAGNHIFSFLDLSLVTPYELRSRKEGRDEDFYLG